LFIVVNLYGVQQRLHFAKRPVRQKGRLSRKLRAMRFIIWFLHKMQRRVQAEKRCVRSRNDGGHEHNRRQLPAGDDEIRRRMLLYAELNHFA